eukprot:scaffold34495_cov52-Phaeocystis_antarctica.AAC.1
MHRYYVSSPDAHMLTLVRFDTTHQTWFTSQMSQDMLSLRANCRFQVRAVVVLSLPALGE